jgi:hypothetical protein
MFLFARRDVGVDPSFLNVGKILVRAIGGVRQHLRGRLARLASNGGDHRHELMLVVRFLGHRLAPDQLQGGKSSWSIRSLTKNTRCPSGSQSRGLVGQQILLGDIRSIRLRHSNVTRLGWSVHSQNQPVPPPDG